MDTVRAERAEEVNGNNGLKGTVRVEKGHTGNEGE